MYRWWLAWLIEYGSLWNCTKGHIHQKQGWDWFWGLCLLSNKGTKESCDFEQSFFYVKYLIAIKIQSCIKIELCVHVCPKCLWFDRCPLGCIFLKINIFLCAPLKTKFYYVPCHELKIKNKMHGVNTIISFVIVFNYHVLHYSVVPRNNVYPVGASGLCLQH